MVDAESERQIAHVEKRIKGSTSAGNFEVAEKYLRFLRAKGSSPRTVAKNMYCLASFIGYLPRKADLAKATKDEIEEAVGRIEGSDYSPNTKQNIKVVIKSLYKHLSGEDYYYPKQVAWIRTSINRYKKKLPDILSEDEVLRMLSATKNPRDAAMIALLFDTGMRVGELIGLKAKDINLEGRLAHVTVDGKTGMRRIPITFSAKYLARYLETVDAEPNGPVWKPAGTWSNKDLFLDTDVVRRIVQRAGKRAGIKKRIYPHLFRHSRASDYANKLTEQQLKAFFGWTGSSQMAATYVHLSGRDIDNAVLQANGMKPPDSIAEPKMKARICQRCGQENSVSSMYCTRCGSAIDIATAMTNEKMAEELEESAAKNMADEREGSSVAKGYRRRRDAKRQ